MSNSTDIAKTLDTNKLIETLEAELSECLTRKEIADPVMIGIQTGGCWIAEKLHQSLKIKQPLGELNISFYRDDFTEIGLHPQIKPSTLPFTVEGQHIILVDDVIMSGRTIRAAMNELFDYGRPASVILVTLLDLNAHELPIQADIRGATINLSTNERIKLSGPNPLKLTMHILEE